MGWCYYESRGRVLWPSGTMVTFITRSSLPVAASGSQRKLSVNERVRERAREGARGRERE